MEDMQREDLKEYNCLCREIDGLYHELAVRAGMSDSAFFILYAITEMGDGCLQRDISEHYYISKQTINSSIRNLESKGYVLLINGKGHDKHIHLTKEGKMLVKEKIFPVIQLENGIFEEMTLKERYEIIRLTRKYIEIFKNKMNGEQK